jgi:hypothetical protein
MPLLHTRDRRQRGWQQALLEQALRFDVEHAPGGVAEEEAARDLAPGVMTGTAKWLRTGR